jgi:hypothetical protein
MLSIASASQARSQWACDPGAVEPVGGAIERPFEFCASGATRAGSGLEHFMAKLRRDNTAPPPHTANRSVIIVGNSVAKWLRFLVARMVTQMLGRRFPNVDFKLLNVQAIVQHKRMPAGVASSHHQPWSRRSGRLADIASSERRTDSPQAGMGLST